MRSFSIIYAKLATMYVYFKLVPRVCALSRQI
jgi:hypothetical protein